MRAQTAGSLVALVVAALVGCGGPAEGTKAPAVAGPVDAGPTTPAAVPSAPQPPKPGPKASASANANANVNLGAAPKPTEMDAKLRDIGLDPNRLPPLEKLDPKTLRDVMNTFTRSLGVGCGHCHEKDFKAPTENKQLAAYMWNTFTRGLALERSARREDQLEGGTLYCDSCHGGRARFLDRHEMGALAAWMNESFVVPLRRTDGNQHGCGTCHGDPFVGSILRVQWKK